MTDLDSITDSVPGGIAKQSILEEDRFAFGILCHQTNRGLELLEMIRLIISTHV